MSLISTFIAQVLIWWFVGGLGWSGSRANIAAVCISSLPSYYMTRHWVWGRERGSHSWRYEVMPFWAMSIAGLIISSLLVKAVDRYYHHAWAISMANMFGFKLLWFLRFFLLDRYLFNDVDRLPLACEPTPSTVARSAALNHSGRS